MTGKSVGPERITEEPDNVVPSAAGDRQSPDLLPRELEQQKGPSEGEGEGEVARAVEFLLLEWSAL